jgi:prepilin-type N-terminal cleavage/methylation domain-containing protein/prepilin-type processing-associated H-X9-DG protein
MVIGYPVLGSQLRRTRATSNQRTRSAFTLIELLLVVAIIAILAALLLPTLSRAKAQGQRIQCASNLHQLHIAFQLYADDHGGVLPSYNGPSWVGLLYNRVPSLSPYPSPSPRLIQDMFHCPTIAKTLNAFTILPLTLTWTWSSNYAINYKITCNLPGSGACTSPLNVASIQRPTETVLLMDRRIDQLPAWSPSVFSDASVDPRSASCLIGFAHGAKSDRGNDGVGNLLFVDGHVTGASMGQSLTARTTP